MSGSHHSRQVDDLEELNRTLGVEPPEEILRWAWERFQPRVALSSSFQTQSVPLLHLVSRVTPRMPVLFLDTGFHFQETLAFRDRLVEQFELELRVLTTRDGHRGFLQRHGLLYRSDPDLCCFLNKVEPMQAAQAELAAWVTGIRRDQTFHRRTVEVLSRLPSGVLKICPLAAWTAADVRSYLERHRLPQHPLTAQGYASIGCSPCTRPVAPGDDERAGRWSGSGKTECGLHLETRPPSRRRGDGPDK